MVIHKGWGKSAFNPKNWNKSSSGSSNKSSGSSNKKSGISSAKDAKGSSGYVSLDAIASAEKNSALDDLQMDLGIKEKNAAYYRDLDERSERSKAALEKMKEDRKKRNKNKPAEPEVEVVEEEPEEEEEVTTPVPPKPPAPPPPINPPGGGTNTADSGKTEADILRNIAEGPAEEKVADTMELGRRSTIMTTPGGLLTDPNDPNLRRKRSLMGGGLIS